MEYVWYITKYLISYVCSFDFSVIVNRTTNIQQLIFQNSPTQSTSLNIPVMKNKE